MGIVNAYVTPSLLDVLDVSCIQANISEELDTSRQAVNQGKIQ
jgi:hypothetical protein